MSRTSTVVYIAAMVAAIVAVDVLFFRNMFWERLVANVVIVAVFLVVYVVWLR